jgi:hypothetical protein
MSFFLLPQKGNMNLLLSSLLSAQLEVYLSIQQPFFFGEMCFFPHQQKLVINREFAVEPPDQLVAKFSQELPVLGG